MRMSEFKPVFILVVLLGCQIPLWASQKPATSSRVYPKVFQRESFLGSAFGRGKATPAHKAEPVGHVSEEARPKYPDDEARQSRKDESAAKAHEEGESEAQQHDAPKAVAARFEYEAQKKVEELRAQIDKLTREGVTGTDPRIAKLSRDLEAAEKDLPAAAQYVKDAVESLPDPAKMQEAMPALMKVSEKLKKAQKTAKDVQGALKASEANTGAAFLSQTLKANPKFAKAGALGAVLLLLLGAVGGGVGAEEGEKKFGPSADSIDSGVLTDEGVIPASPYDDPAPDNDKYQSDLSLMASALNKVEDKFKTALGSADYYNSKFRIDLGTVGSIDDVAIEYNFVSKGAGDVGSAFTPFEVSLIPAELDGFAVKVDQLLALVKEENRELATLLIKPNAAFIFLLKFALLNKTVFNDPTFKDHFERIREISTQSAILCSRLVQTPAHTNPSTQGLLAVMPLPIQKYINETMTKTHPEFVKAAQSSSQQGTSELANAILKIRAGVSGYDDRTSALVDIVLPLIKDGLSYSDQKLVIHALLRHVADMGGNMPKDAAKGSVSAVVNERVSSLIPLISDAIDKMKDAEVDDKDVSPLQKMLTDLKAIKGGATVDVNAIVKPRLGDPKSGIQDITLANAIDIALYQYNILINMKFSGDYGYISSDLLLGKDETAAYLTAILLRGADMASDSMAKLIKEKDPVTLRKSGNEFTINPADELDKLIKGPSADVDVAKKALDAANKTLKADPKNDANKVASVAARKQFDKAVRALQAALQKFRKAYAAYYLIKFSNGSEKTVAEFVKDSLKTAKKVGQKDELSNLPELFSNFEDELGLSLDMVWTVPAPAVAVAAV